MEKKIIVPTIVAVATLVLLVFGATYAYFTIESTNNFGTKELNATVEDMAVSVVLEQVQNTLSLDVTRAMISEDNSGTTYYASGSATPANIAKISVAGEGIYKCDYKVTITQNSSSEEKNLYSAAYNNYLISDDYWNVPSLFLNDEQYFFGDENLFPITYEDSMYNISEDFPKYITTNLMLVNNDWEQNYLKGKDITLTYSISDFKCELSEPTGEYTELAFTGTEFYNINYYYYILDYDDFWHFNSPNIIIPETFQGKNGIWYKVTSIESLAEEATLWKIESIELPNSIERIGDWALGTLGAETLKLPKQVEEIGVGFVGYTDVKQLYLPKSLNDISIGALADAHALQDVYYEGTEAEWNALFSEYVGSGKEYSSIYEYLTANSDEPDMMPEIINFHFNVNY